MTFDGNGIRMMTPWEMLLSRIDGIFTRLRRRLPYLVWYGDELDVRVIFTADKLPPIEGKSLDAVLGEAIAEYQGSPLVETESALRRLGVSFDTGMGSEGRDWEWDWSLRGPISVRFKSRATSPQHRASAQRRTDKAEG